MTEGQEIPFNSEAGKILRFTDTIALPLENGEFVHVETSKPQLTDAFAEYAGNLGYDPEKARTFFDEKVDFTFGTAKNMVYPPQVTIFDKIVDRAISFLRRGDYLGCVPRSKRGGYEFALNTPIIQKYLPKLKIRDVWRVENYLEQTIEEKIASLQQTINSITNHEFYHILQYMEQHELMDQMVRRGILSQRMFCAWTAATLTTSQIAPQYTFPVALLGGLAMLGGVLYVQKDGTIKVEKDAYEKQKKAKGFRPIKQPYTFVHESDPKKQ